MSAAVVGVLNIKQKDNHTFTIQWSDGVTRDYRLSDLQRRCPCAGCVDELTGQRRPDADPVSEDVRAKEIVSVGRYALRIQFTSGCCHGIYDYDLLRGDERGVS